MAPFLNKDVLQEVVIKLLGNYVIENILWVNFVCV